MKSWGNDNLNGAKGKFIDFSLVEGRRSRFSREKMFEKKEIRRGNRKFKIIITLLLKNSFFKRYQQTHSEVHLDCELSAKISVFRNTLPKFDDFEFCFFFFFLSSPSVLYYIHTHSKLSFSHWSHWQHFFTSSYSSLFVSPLFSLFAI